MPLVDELAVIGVGLIGGSFALALKAAGAVRRVVGVGRDPARLGRALELGIVDAIETSPERVAGTARLVLVATPVGSMHDILARLAPHLAAETVITDGGSTKQSVVDAAYAALGDKVGQFVPAHPIAGSEQSGAEAARADLYTGREVVLTPLPENSPASVELVRAAWRAAGARVTEMNPAEHDAVLAAVSHLPHLLAFGFVQMLAARPDRSTLFAHAGSGFRDFTRIAGSHPAMWRDICLANRDALLLELRGYQEALARLGALLERGDAAGLERAFDEARTARAAYLAARGGE